MGRYVVLSNGHRTAGSVGLASRKMTVKDRQEQITEAIERGATDPVRDEVCHWTQDRQGVRWRSGSSSGPRIEQLMPLLGAAVITMDPAAAVALREEVSGITLIADQRIGLIRPRRTAAGPVRKLTAAHCWHREAIGLGPARARSRRRGPAVTVAVLDTGVDASHPALAGKVSAACAIDASSGQMLPMSPSSDTDGHGTHVAGLICGQRIGVAPQARILSGVIIPRGYGWLSGFLSGLSWAASRPEVQVVNISAGFPGYLPEFRFAIDELLAVGVLPIVAVGNEGRGRTRSPGNDAGVISVGATNRAGRVSRFSGSGTLVVDQHRYSVPHLVAPGEGITSCALEGGFEAWDGTSMAAPIVAGIAALILQEHPDLTVLHLREEIISRCRKLDEHDDRQGQGLVQVRAV